MFFWQNTKDQAVQYYDKFNHARFFSHILSYNSHTFLLILQRKNVKSIIYMDQTEEDSETWKIENLSTHNNYELKKTKRTFARLLSNSMGKERTRTIYDQF